MVDALEARTVRSVRDELDIRNVLARIAHLTDRGDLDLYAEQFTEDAVWETPGAEPSRGRDRIRSDSATRRSRGVTGPGTHTMHVISTVTVTLHGDAATAESYWQFFSKTNATPVLRSMGQYRDTFLRTADGWRLARRQITSR